MFKNNNDFDSVIKENWDNPIFDGIIDMDSYQSSETKILWILSEPKKYKQNNTEVWSDRNFHRNGITEISNCDEYYKRIIYISYNLLNNNYSWKDIPDIKNNNDEINYFKNIAIIFINKSSDCSFSDQTSIDEKYLNKRTILLQQIENIAPTNIINANSCYSLFKDLAYRCPILDKVPSLFAYKLN